MSGGAGPNLPLGAAVAGRRYALLGLARTGLAAVAALIASGAVDEPQKQFGVADLLREIVAWLKAPRADLRH